MAPALPPIGSPLHPKRLPADAAADALLSAAASQAKVRVTPDSGADVAIPPAAPDVAPINLRGHTTDELVAKLAPLGVPAGQARQVMAHVMRGGAGLEGVRGLSKARQATLNTRTCAPRLTLVGEEVSGVDGFKRYLFQTHDGHSVEAVRIPLKADRYTVCLSSQVGCALGCVFCETGRLGFKRNLAAWEMVDQLLQVRERADRAVTGAVFMGQGEPLLNYDEVIRAATILREPTGGRIRAEAITISTAGILPAMRRFIDEAQPFRLILSLTAATSEKRRALMPIERKYPLPELIAALGDYARAQRTRATIAWVAMGGVNTSAEDVKALKALLGDLPVRFNLIEVNDPSGRFVPPSDHEREAFLDALKALGAPMVRRYTGGKDINAACGMLAATAARAGGMDPSVGAPVLAPSTT